MRRNLDLIAVLSVLSCAALMWIGGCAARGTHKSPGAERAHEVAKAPMAPAISATPKPPDSPKPPEARFARGHAVVLSRGTESEAQILLKEAARTLNDVENILKLPPSDAVVTIRLFDSRSAMRAYLKEACPDRADSAAASFYTAGGCVIALYRQGDAQTTLRQVRHETAHFAVMERFREIPPWIHEGLASCFEEGKGCSPPSRAALDQLRDDAAEGNEGVMTALVDLPAGAPLDPKGYASAWALAHFLLTQLEDGPAAVRSYLERVRAGQPAAEQFAAAFGTSPAELEPAWRLYLVRMMAPAKNGD